MRRRNRYLLFICIVFFYNCGSKENCQLPHLGQHEIVNGDTVYYTIPKFVGLKNQDEQIVGFRQWEGKVFIAEFFFSQCKSICPIMTSQMARIQDVIMQSGWQGKVALLSHTIDPVYDQPAILKQYAQMHGANPTIWSFVNLDSSVYKLAQEGYGLSAFPSVEAEGGFFHTDQITLVDEHFHIRGYYDGTSTESVNELIEDLTCLMQEHH